MAWSTREIAELAGTSLRAVRHYHEVGLLDEPERRSNGYKRYGVAHLVRLLRIKRLVDLGFSLTQISEMNDTDDHPHDALRGLDAELGATIERLQRARVEIGLILRQEMPTDLPPEFATAAGREMSQADRSFVTVLSRVIDPQMQQDYAEVIRDSGRDPVSAEFDELPEDADAAARQDLAERMAPQVRKMYQENPEIRDFVATAPRGRRFAAETVGKALRELYNPAQIDVLVRMESLLAEPGDADAPETT